MQNVDFSVIVNMFGMEGMVALGKMKHPASDSLQKNLEQAKFIIDILSVLESKTSGNLTDVEQRTLDYTLSNLRLNFVQESSSATQVSAAASSSENGEA